MTGAEPEPGLKLRTWKAPPEWGEPTMRYRAKSPVLAVPCEVLHFGLHGIVRRALVGLHGWDS